MMNSIPASPMSNWPPSEELSAGRLRGYVQPVGALSPATRQPMYRLLARYFAGVSEAAFAADLAEKEAVILLEDQVTGELQGFSTLMRLALVVEGEPLVAFFSGDTIIARDYWGESVLPRLWARYVFGVAATLPERAYWFLISSGYKTYRFLPLFFREFYPTHECPTPPAMQRRLDAIARHKFPQGYDPASGIVRLPHATPLHPDVAAIEARRLRDPHVAFFVAANPGHAQGDELACLTEISPANLTRAGRRMLG